MSAWSAIVHPDEPPSHQRRSLDWLERLTLGHLLLLLVFGAWAFGGNALWVRDVLSIWGTLSLLLTCAVLRDKERRNRGHWRPLRWLWPFAAFNLLVLASACNPSFREVTDGARLLYVESTAKLPLPSSALPSNSLHSLWFFDAIYVSCFNLVLVIRERRTLRFLLFVLAANAMALAVFGTVQKLLGAQGLFFGAVPSPQPLYFASFIYHNHWGAFTLLMIAISLGLIFRYARRKSGREFLHSPAFSGLVAIILLAASVPLSGSRSSTVLVALLLAAAFGHWMLHLIRQKRGGRGSLTLPLTTSTVVLLLAAGFAYTIGGDVIGPRMEAADTQIVNLNRHGESFRAERVYRDTWNMAREKLCFGWGMGTYELVFQTRNTAPIPTDGPPIHSFHDAHCDWLQSTSEVGLVGTALLGLCALVPLWHRRKVIRNSPLSLYLLAGCALVALYAWVEFPFGNREVVAVWWACFFCAIHYGRIQGDEPPTHGSDWSQPVEPVDSPRP